MFIFSNNINVRQKSLTSMLLGTLLSNKRVIHVHKIYNFVMVGSDRIRADGR